MDFKVGDGVTMYLYSDRQAGTITRISKSGKCFWFKLDNAKVISGSEGDGSAKYEYLPDNTRPERRATKTKYGWSSYGNPIGFGRDQYYDPTF
jgi:hypothetical protein